MGKEDTVGFLKLIEKRSAILAWPLINPVTQDAVDGQLATVRHLGRPKWAGCKCVEVSITNRGRKLLG